MVIATFTVAQSAEGSGEPSGFRQQKRAYLSPDVLRTYKLAAGDWVTLTPSGGADNDKATAAQLWPRVDVEDDCEPRILAVANGRHCCFRLSSTQSRLGED